MRKRLAIETLSPDLTVLEEAFPHLDLKQLVSLGDGETGEIAPQPQLLQSARNADHRFWLHWAELANQSPACGDALWHLLTFYPYDAHPAVPPARLDPVTGLPDRRVLEIAFHGENSTSAGSNTRSTLLFLDLNGFKRVNDTWGHRAGDYILQEVAHRWKQSLRHDDLLVRYGGDEFVILLSKITELAEAEHIAERLQETLEKPFELDAATITLGVSIGIALPRPGEDLATLLERADREMYQRKGRACK